MTGFASYMSGIRAFVKKLHYCRLKREQILILDENGSQYIKQMVLWDQPTTILHSLTTRIYLSPGILLRMLTNLPKAVHREPGFFKIYWRALYYASLIQWLAPKVVITYIDNGSDFQLAARFYRKPRWFFIQNGTRWPSLLIPPYLPAPPDKRSTIRFDNWFCFGESEVRLFQRYGHEIAVAYPVGSLLGSWFLSNVRQPRTDKEFDICLVSQHAPHVMENPASRFRFAVYRLEEHLKRYLDQRGVSLVIALRSSEAAEIEYFQHNFKDIAQIVINDRTTMSTFAAIDRSRVTLSITSTVAYEAFGWGSKVMFCNFSDDPDYDTPIGGPWCLNQNSYEMFEQRLDALLAMPEDRYQESTAKDRTYFMKYDTKEPAYLFIRRTLLDCIENHTNKG